MTNINIILDSLTNQEAFTAISYANLFNTDNKYLVNLFVESVKVPIIKPNAAIFPLEKALYSKDIVIATSISTARYLKNCIANKKVLYLWEIEWIYKNMDYLEIHKLLNNIDILICQSEYHKKAILNISNRKVDDTIINFDLNKILERIL